MAILWSAAAGSPEAASLVLSFGVVRILLAVLEHLVLRLLLLLQIFFHFLLLLLLSFSLGAALGVDRVIGLGSGRDGEAEAGNCQAKRDGQSFHKFSVNERLLARFYPRVGLIWSIVGDGSYREPGWSASASCEMHAQG
jgi:hypothetical protein